MNRRTLAVSLAAAISAAAGAAWYAAPSRTAAGAAEAAPPAGSMTRGGAAEAAPPAGSMTRGGASTAPSAGAHGPSEIRTMMAPGRVEPHRAAVDLMFEQPGRIQQILVEEGDAVVAGQVVARLDDRAAKARVAAAMAQVDAARARLDELHRGARPDEIAAARAEADAARAAAEQSVTDRERADRLLAAAAVPAAEAESERARARVAQAQADAAASRARLVARGARAEQIRAAQAELDLAGADLDAAQVALDQCALRAPAAGVVLRRKAEVGTLVTPQIPVPVVSVADHANLELRVEVDEADVDRVAVGQRGWATALAYGDRRFPGRIVRITGELGRKTALADDPRARVDTRVLEVVLSFDPDSGAAELPLGLRMDAHLPPSATAAAQAVTAER